MLRLALDAFEHVRPESHPLSFSAGATWFSEARLPSAFRPRRRGDKLSESYTHADGVIGQIEIDPSGRGYLELAASATQMVVIEAKMFSRLSAGVRNAPTFHQAARSIACMAQLLCRSERQASNFENLGFYVLASQETIDAGVFRLQLTKEHIRAAVKERVAAYGAGTAEWHADWFDPLVERINIECLSWEGILQVAEPAGPAGPRELAAFYENCLRFNRPRRSP